MQARTNLPNLVEQPRSTMPLLLLELGAHPGRIAATLSGSCLPEGAFFLDFSRPLRVERWLLVWNFRIGYPWALHVPLVHQGEAQGTRQIAIERADPYFAELKRLWQTRHPQPLPTPASAAEPARVASDYAAQFPA
jgi:hypothetical protein